MRKKSSSVSDIVMFPARSQFNGGTPSDFETVPFEIFSRDDSLELPGSLIGQISVENQRWSHRLASLSPYEYRDILSSLNSDFEKQAGYLSSSLFGRFVRHRKRPSLMGIVNITPDSFYEGSRLLGKSFSAIDSILEEKPEIVDIGGESTRPGSSRLEIEKEIDRIKPVLEYLSTSYSIPLSVDTRNPDTADFCLRYGIKYLNDVSGFSNPEMIRIAAENSLDSIIMHMRGEPQNMQTFTDYTDLIFELNLFFNQRVERMIAGGIDPSRVIVDPGIGFGKDLEGNIDIIRNLKSLNVGYRILVGASRKTFIGKITGESPEGRLPGTLATSISLMNRGADIIRVHDVKDNREAMDVYASIEWGIS